MKSFILCGGMGTRLGIAKNTPPKALIKIGSEPILIHLIKIYLKNDINEIVLCLGYKGKIILDYFIKKFKQVYKNEGGRRLLFLLLLCLFQFNLK